MRLPSRWVIDPETGRTLNGKSRPFRSALFFYPKGASPRSCHRPDTEDRTTVRNNPARKASIQTREQAPKAPYDPIGATRRRSKHSSNSRDMQTPGKQTPKNTSAPLPEGPGSQQRYGRKNPLSEKPSGRKSADRKPFGGAPAAKAPGRQTAFRKGPSVFFFARCRRTSETELQLVDFVVEGQAMVRRKPELAARQPVLPGGIPLSLIPT